MPPRLGIRMPPGPPPGMPTNRMHHPHQQQQQQQPHHHNQHNKPQQQQQPPHSNLQAAPQLLTKDTTKGMTTITAKPQIRYDDSTNLVCIITMKFNTQHFFVFFCCNSMNRNLSADVTRFVPTALRNKRDEKSKQPHPMQPHQLRHQPQSRPFFAGPHHPHMVAPGHDNAAPKPATKDDAYMQFMREMKGLL